MKDVTINNRNANAKRFMRTLHENYSGANAATSKIDRCGFSAPAARNIKIPSGVSRERRISSSASRLFQTERILQMDLSVVLLIKKVRII